MQSKQIDLNKMENLLSGFNKNKESLEKCNQKDNSIGIDMFDICSILNYQGKILGTSSITTIDNLYEDILDNIPKSKFKNSKVVLFIFFNNDKTSLVPISDVMSKFNELLSKDQDVLFDLKSDNDLMVDEVSYRLIITGIK